MSIEKNLERIADALETIAAAHTVEMIVTPISKGDKVTGSSSTKAEKSTGSKSDSKESSKTSSGPELTKDDVRDALKTLQKAKGAAAARALLADHDAKTLTDLKTDEYMNVINAAEAQANG